MGEQPDRRPVSRRALIGGGIGAAALAGLPIESEPALAAVAGYNLPFTNLPEPGTIVPVYDSSDGWHTRPGGGHHGIDFNGPGTVANRKIYPIRRGTVTGLQADPTGKSTELGRVVKVTHDNGVVSWYCHLQTMTVTQGQSVGPGSLLGTIGNTGTASTGAHLHLAVFPYAGAHDVDPWPYLNGAPYANQVGDDELTPEQDSMLSNLYAAMFTGGPSMPSGMSLTSILQPGRVIRNGTLPNPGNVGEYSLFQEVADAKTLLLKQQQAVAAVSAKIDAISARLG